MYVYGRIPTSIRLLFIHNFPDGIARLRGFVNGLKYCWRALDERFGYFFLIKAV